VHYATAAEMGNWSVSVAFHHGAIIILSVGKYHLRVLRRNIDLTQQKTSQALSFFEKRSYLGSYQSCSLKIKVALTGLWSWMSTSSLSVRK
jgi:TPR repeat protein